MSTVEIFNRIRDIPYQIPLSFNEKDACCTGKHKLLKQELENAGYKTRWQVCAFRWSGMDIPQTVLEKPHEDDSTHAYLEVEIDGVFKKIDATWDNGLADVFTVNVWDGVSDTHIAVPCKEIFSPEESQKIIDSEDREIIEADLLVNGSFYKALNEWLDDVRKRAS